MGRVRNALRAYSAVGSDPTEVVERLDRLVALFDVDDIVTLVFGVVDADLTAFRFVTAGHVPPLVVARDGQRFAGSESADPPLGTGRSHAFREEVVRLEPGDSLLLYTDGLVERREESLSVGLDRLLAAAPTIRGIREQDEAMTVLLHALLHDGEPSDDVALLLLRRDDVSPTVELRVPAHPAELVIVRRALRRWLADLGVASRDHEDVITAAGEACANAVEHAYGPVGGWVHLAGTCDDGTVEVIVRDGGRWRARPSDRGRGMMLMRAVMDSVELDRSAAGTTVTMRRRVSRR
jgi:anti-sigma regulatory factor (Ser/Thr protein kinase)